MSCTRAAMDTWAGGQVIDEEASCGPGVTGWHRSLMQSASDRCDLRSPGRCAMLWYQAASAG